VIKSNEVRTQQEAVNESEWEDPANWWGSLLYRSKRDNRLWVPKRVASFGETINLGRPLGLVIAVAIPGLILAFILTAALGY
jgi:uncharacterized membrane protein